MAGGRSPPGAAAQKENRPMRGGGQARRVAKVWFYTRDPSAERGSGVVGRGPATADRRRVRLPYSLSASTGTISRASPG
jgi:hypothetical protein